ncbi:MAG TPA: DUF3467 domain-containing protein [Bryobacteraceae bacterium]|nr:DUF3467 domain-containing protein [Bryobacteraceae bacterium]
MNNEAKIPQDQSGEGTVNERMVHIPFPETFTYANCAAFAISQMEIRLGFAEAMQDGKAVPKVGIVLPPEAAAVIAIVLFQQVRTYEENFGEIRHPLWKAMKAGQPLSINPKEGTIGIPPEASPAAEPEAE